MENRISLLQKNFWGEADSGGLDKVGYREYNMGIVGNCGMLFEHEDVFFQMGAILRSGIYVLTWKGEVMYVGQSERMFARLYAHCMGRQKRKLKLGGRVIGGVVFDDIWVAPVLPSDLRRVEKEFIEYYEPKYNRHHKDGPKLSIEELVAAIQLEETPAPQEPVLRIRRRL